ncbi:MAG: hypothetical protein KDD70_17390 [Bdellovibrionales bacterium]|nr:hypothetical protein [Bdellovibrionales bacterium]
MRFANDSAATLVEVAILLPLIFIIAAVTYDLARLYVNSVYANEIALYGAKLANSSDPDGYAFPDSDLANMIRSPSGEDAGITTKRQAFWTNQLDPTHSKFWGLTYYPRKDKAVLNLLYGFAVQLSDRIYFPIPEQLDGSDPVSELGGRVNCSIWLEFPTRPPLEGTWGTDTNAILNASRDRIIHVRCAVPMFGLRLATFNDQQVQYVSASAYAFDAGTIRP